MRIISGTHKGKKIIAPKHLSARPTTDMAKEALFNILRNRFYLSECKILDLFSGTGNISYEFASRSSSDVTAVDRDTNSVKFISKTAKILDFPIKVLKSDVNRFLKKTTEQFDIIFADPPYRLEYIEFEEMVKLIFERSVIREEGLLIIEHSKHTDLSTLDYFSESRRYGSSVFSFFTK